MATRVAYEARNKMPPGSLINQPHHRIHRDVVDNRGHVALRYLGKLRHLNVGWTHQGDPIRLYIVDDLVDVVTEDGELVCEITLNAERDYQPITRNVRPSIHGFERPRCLNSFQLVSEAV